MVSISERSKKYWSNRAEEFSSLRMKEAYNFKKCNMDSRGC